MKNGPDIEVLELSISREMEAYHFYMALAERIENPQMRQVFEEFAEEELQHKAKLELEVLKLGKTLAVNKEPLNPTGNYVPSNINSLLDMDYKDILLLAISKEDASFKTYINLIPHLPDQQSRDTLLAIAEEEVKHKHRFEIEYELLMKKQS